MFILLEWGYWMLIILEFPSFSTRRMRLILGSVFYLFALYCLFGLLLLFFILILFFWFFFLVFLIWGFTSLSGMFHSYVDVTIANEGLQMLTYTLHSWPLSNEGSLPCKAYCVHIVGTQGWLLFVPHHPWGIM